MPRAHPASQRARSSLHHASSLSPPPAAAWGGGAGPTDLGLQRMCMACVRHAQRGSGAGWTVTSVAGDLALTRPARRPWAVSAALSCPALALEVESARRTRPWRALTNKAPKTAAACSTIDPGGAQHRPNASGKALASCRGVTSRETGERAGAEAGLRQALHWPWRSAGSLHARRPVGAG